MLLSLVETTSPRIDFVSIMNMYTLLSLPALANHRNLFSITLVTREGFVEDRIMRCNSPNSSSYPA